MKKSVISRREEYYYRCYAALGVVCSALLAVAILVAAPLQGQRIGGGFHDGGSGMPVGNALGFSGRPGFPNGSFPHHPGYRRFRNDGWGFASWYYPYWDDEEPFDVYPESAMNVGSPPVTAPPVVVVESHDYRPPAPVPEGPKLIEVPQTKGTATTSKPEPPTLFVLANGERLVAPRYMLTTDSLRVEIRRQQRQDLARRNRCRCDHRSQSLTRDRPQNSDRQE